MMKYLDLKEFRQALGEARAHDLSDDELRELLDRVSRHDYPPEEVERDIGEAVAAVREGGGSE